MTLKTEISETEQRPRHFSASHFHPMQTKLKNAGVLIGLLLACLVARRLAAGDGTEPGSPALAMGVIAGYLFGAAVSLWGVAYQKHVARTRPENVWVAYAAAFFAKLIGIAVGPMIVFLFPAMAERMDAGAFVISYGFAAVIALLLGTAEVARAHKAKSILSSAALNPTNSPESGSCI
ncbi:MAG: hypothetical protein ACI8TQ_000092 [Planctomycetota bacterium]|jgi:hypothetical protein